MLSAQGLQCNARRRPLFLSFVVVLLGLLLINSAREALTGAAIALLGAPCCWLTKPRRARAHSGGGSPQ